MIGGGVLLGLLAAVAWTTAEQRFFAHDEHGSPTLAIACLLGGALLYAVVAILAAGYRARRSRVAAVSSGR